MSISGPAGLVMVMDSISISAESREGQIRWGNEIWHGDEKKRGDWVGDSELGVIIKGYLYRVGGGYHSSHR